MSTRHRLATICLFSLLFVTSAFAQAPEGIPRELARFRAQQIKDVRYQLSYTITPKADSVSGHEELRFVLTSYYDRGPTTEWLDFREGADQQTHYQRQDSVAEDSEWPRRASGQIAPVGRERS